MKWKAKTKVGNHLLHIICYITGLIAEQFLKATASQLTCHGVVKMLETMGEQQLAVFFRNNHFSTLYKKNVSFHAEIHNVF